MRAVVTNVSNLMLFYRERSRAKRSLTSRTDRFRGGSESTAERYSAVAMMYPEAAKGGRGKTGREDDQFPMTSKESRARARKVLRLAGHGEV
jgi:hypothetical protein